MGQRYLIDSNTLIYFIENKLPKAGKTELTKILNNESNFSFVSKIECLAHSKISEEHEIKFRSFFSHSKEYLIDDFIIEKTISIKKETGIKLPDAIIAATALIHNLTLITRNEKDFLKIKGLKIINPFTL